MPRRTDAQQPVGNVREALIEKFERMADRPWFRERACRDPYSPKAEALRAGEPTEVSEWQLCGIVPGCWADGARRFRVGTDGSAVEVARG